MEKREVRRKSTRTVPVIIENHENAAKKTKLMVPSNYTAGQLVNILRSRMRLRPSHPVYLFLKSKQSPVLMSKSIGHLHHKHRDEKGLLRLIHAGQTSFGFRGNIRAIRFRQKWIENLHNTMHQSAGGQQLNSDMPPPNFPVDPPTTANFGVPLDLDSLSDSNEEMPFPEDLYHFTDYSEIEDSFLAADTPSWLSPDTTSSSQSALTNSSQSSVLTISSHLSAVTDLANAWMSSSLLDPWQPSANTNSGQTAGMLNSSLLTSYQEAINTFELETGNTFDLEMGLAAGSLQNAAAPGSSSGLDTYGNYSFVVGSNSSNPPVLLYESDSDWSVDDKDVDSDD